MATKFVKYHNVVLPALVKDGFALLAENIYRDLGTSIQPLDGYKTKYEILLEIANRIKYPDRSKLNGSDLINYVQNLSPLDFEPPLTGNQFAGRDSTEILYTIPNKPDLDPRVTGRIVQIGPKNIINPTTLYYLVHNAGNYGFLHYGPKDPSIWYWRGDKDPKIYTAQQVVSTFSNELSYLL